MRDLKDPARLERASHAVDAAERLRGLAFDPSVVDYFNRRENELKEAAVAAIATDPDTARIHALELRVLRDFRAHLSGALRSGAIAAKNLKDMS